VRSWSESVTAADPSRNRVCKFYLLLGVRIVMKEMISTVCFRRERSPSRWSLVSHPRSLNLTSTMVSYTNAIRRTFFFKFYWGTWPSNLMVPVSLRLGGVVGARINVRSSYLQWGPPWPEFEPRFPRLQAQRLTTELSHYFFVVLYRIQAFIRSRADLTLLYCDAPHQTETRHSYTGSSIYPRIICICRSRFRRRRGWRKKYF